MTRANLLLITKYGTFKFEWGSDAYPEDVKDFLIALAKMDEAPDVDWLAEHNPAGRLCPGTIGNPYYYYEVNQKTRTVRMWDSTTYWINAPADWKERGWHCWKGTNGRDGYTNWRKGKLLKTLNVSKVA